ncbi:ribonuclease P/MRP protein subunit RPP1 [Cladophialophora yegresii CBS 114405]|uniref:Ribonuclease P/MRP protein subunit RPP1 n=1 Tax=Cladophialophora yegresii CBS 114405 TaxID=1182544 RepID=W9VMV1_9EURO|nr:ribonuclease P/MRP protein subunit RPP1 [Cladophialophora yegresii CBS 114405]EXJ57042.1 ribonuclease P/MRP protein subunit RPP1 [Cladophialophora yegresii CBS 114405]
MPFHDLSLPYTTNHADLSHTLAFHAELGYSVVAVSLTVTGKLPSQPQEIPISALTIPKTVTTVLTRLTLTISDATQNHRLTQFSPAYNLLALRPTTEKTLQLCCTSLECDLISLDLSQRLTHSIKFKTVSSALQRGTRFEICYAPAIQALGNSEARRNLISGATQLIRATRGRGIILSSEAKNALGVRGPHDVINLAQIWGLGQERGKEALCEEAEKVVRLAAMKRTSFRGIIDIIDGGGQATEKGKDIERGKEVINNAAKRKASNTSLAASTAQEDQKLSDDKPLSKREMKRRAKKARLEAAPGNGHDSKAGPDDVGADTARAQDTSALHFSIKA